MLRLPKAFSLFLLFCTTLCFASMIWPGEEIPTVEQRFKFNYRHADAVFIGNIIEQKPIFGDRLKEAGPQSKVYAISFKALRSYKGSPREEFVYECSPFAYCFAGSLSKSKKVLVLSRGGDAILIIELSPGFESEELRKLFLGTELELPN